MDHQRLGLPLADYPSDKKECWGRMVGFRAPTKVQTHFPYGPATGQTRGYQAHGHAYNVIAGTNDMGVNFPGCHPSQVYYVGRGVGKVAVNGYPPLPNAHAILLTYVSCQE